MSFVTIFVIGLLSSTLVASEPERVTHQSTSSAGMTPLGEVPDSSVPGSQTGRTYLDVDGEPLPFSNDEQLLDFLDTAKVTTVKKIATGINGALKVRLEKNGVVAHGVFRTVARSAIRERSHGAPSVRDHYLFEKAAFDLARRLEIDSVPATVVRKVDGKQGTLQLWIENAVGGTDLLFVEDRPTWHELTEQRREMRLFDELVYNFDRHLQNVLVDESGHVWLIDHTRTFPAAARLQNPDDVDYDPEFATRLRSLSATELRKTVKPYLKAHELHALLVRRKTLLRHFDKFEAASAAEFEVAQVATYQED